LRRPRAQFLTEPPANHQSIPHCSGTVTRLTRWRCFASGSTPSVSPRASTQRTSPCSRAPSAHQSPASRWKLPGSETWLVSFFLFPSYGQLE
jgi:hypothetical protein